MTKLFYRFRKISSLFGEHKELENQSIYFAHPNQLNDPMEGFRNIHWSGDTIVWTNLFKHYLLCLENLCSRLLVGGEDYIIKPESIPVFMGEGDLPTKQCKDLFSEIYDNFFANENIQNLISQISERSTPVRRDELSFYLSTVHPFALDVVYNIYGKFKYTSQKTKKNQFATHMLDVLINKDFIKNIEKTIIENNGDEEAVNKLFAIERQSHDQLGIIHYFNGDFDQSKSNKNLILIEFIENYLQQLEKLIYPDWYTACFMSECNNSSVWGHYGDNHKGVCLIFGSEDIDDNHFLPLKSITGISSSTGTTYGSLNHQFHSVHYEKGYEEINFFKSLGCLPIPKLNSAWYTANGHYSECATYLSNSIDQWRKTYWDKFYSDITVKSIDWKYEKEYRIILSSSLNSYQESQSRSLTYDFKSLKGIIFGINTSKSDKLKIMKVIETKCEINNRDDFKFYQAYYSNKSRTIEHTEMRLLKFSHSV